DIQPAAIAAVRAGGGHRALGGTGPFAGPVHDGVHRAGVDTGAARVAPHRLQRQPEGSVDAGLRALVRKFVAAETPNLVARPHTAGAENALVEVQLNKG